MCTSEGWDVDGLLRCILVAHYAQVLGEAVTNETVAAVLAKA